MNIALGTLLLFLLVIPGIALRKTYMFGERSKKYSKLSAFDDFIWAIIPGAFFQFAGTIVVNSCPSIGYVVDFSGLGSIIYSSKEATTAFAHLQQYMLPIFLYNLTLIATAAVIGYGFRKIIEHANLDYRIKFLRFDNEWHYLLRGEFVFFKDHKEKDRRNAVAAGVAPRTGIAAVKGWFTRKKPDVCYAYVVTKSEKAPTIFLGLIDYYFLTKDGQLDTIWLAKVAKRPLNCEPDTPWIAIDTDVVVLKNDEIVDLSIEVVLLEELVELIVPEAAPVVSKGPGEYPSFPLQRKPAGL